MTIVKFTLHNLYNGDDTLSFLSKIFYPNQMKKIFICIFNFAIISVLWYKGMYYIRDSFRETNIFNNITTSSSTVHI